MDFWSSLLGELLADNTPLMVLGLLVTYALVRVLCPDERPRLVLILYMVGLHVLLLPVAAYLHHVQADFYPEVRLATLILATLAGIGMINSLVFVVLLPRVGLRSPRILHDVLFGVMSALAVFALASNLGFNVAGLIATSAVLTAVIGFALQGTLGNLIGGLAIQLDDTVSVDNWVSVGGVVGRVTQIRWRYTALETRQWETILIPNGQLMNAQVVLLGKRYGQPLKWRREVDFRVDYFHAPTVVIEAVEHSLLKAPLECVSQDPPVQVLLEELGESFGRYTVRYWLNDPEQEGPVASALRTRVYFALKRARIRLALPSEQVFLTHTDQRATAGQARHEAYKLKILDDQPLFASLSEAERRRLAEQLTYAPFAAGERVLVEGEETTELYILTRGECGFLVSGGDGQSREVARLAAPAVFGEMALMTGAPRSASTQALGDIECYRLEREAFEAVIQARPEVADHIAMTLAQRQMELEAVREDLQRDEDRLEARRWELLSRIQGFFGLRSGEGRR